MTSVSRWWRDAAPIAVAAWALTVACGGDEPNAFDNAQNMSCHEWRALPRDERARQVGILRDMQNPSDELLEEVESECTNGRDLAKALLEASLTFEAENRGD